MSDVSSHSVVNGEPVNWSVTDFQERVDNNLERSAISDIIRFTVLLERCIIDKYYRISDGWTRPIRLTSVGEEIRAGCLSKNKRIKPNEATLAVFLEIGCSGGLLFDPLASDLNALRVMLSSEISSGKIRYPYIFGRDLHDLIVDMHAGKAGLSNKETMDILSRLPVGVFQSGRTTVGPYGCQVAPHPRDLWPSTVVPGYYCSDETCREIHLIRLNTADSGIVRARGVVSSYIHTHYPKGHDEYVEIAQRTQVIDHLENSDGFEGALFDCLSDGLTEDELRAVIDRLLRAEFRRNGGGDELSRRIGAVITNPTGFVESISRAELLHLALLHTDKAISMAVDEAVISGAIRLESYEIRKGMISRWRKGGRAEVGSRGIRTVRPPRRLSPDKVYRLLAALYYRSPDLDSSDLAYHLEEDLHLDEGEMISRAARSLSPGEIVERLVLSTRKTRDAACEFLGVYLGDSPGRDEVTARILWKLGVTPPVEFSDLVRAKAYEEEFRSAVDRGDTEDNLKGLGTKLFTAVEDSAQRSLIYCVWALFVDHFLEDEGFVYDSGLSPQNLSTLEDLVPASDGQLKLDSNVGAKNTLKPLAAGFSRLAKSLKRLDVGEHERQIEQYPPECVATRRPFAFSSRVPFLNLDLSSQGNTLAQLQGISRRLQSGCVLDLRNACAHGNTPLPARGKILEGMDLIREWRVTTEEAGLYPTVFVYQESKTDSLGRVEGIYRSHNNVEISLYQPQWAVAPRLPRGAEQLLIMPIAITTSSGPLRFHLKSRPGRDPYWEGYPKRWNTKARYSGSAAFVDTPDTQAEQSVQAV